MAKDKHFDECMVAASKLELEGKVVEAGCMRVAASNDYSNWKAVPKPLLREVPLLHHSHSGTGVCCYCFTPMDDWEPMEKCQGRYDK